MRHSRTSATPALTCTQSTRGHRGLHPRKYSIEAMHQAPCSRWFTYSRRRTTPGHPVGICQARRLAIINDSNHSCSGHLPLLGSKGTEGLYNEKESDASCVSIGRPQNPTFHARAGPRSLVVGTIQRRDYAPRHKIAKGVPRTLLCEGPVDGLDRLVKKVTPWSCSRYGCSIHRRQRVDRTAARHVWHGKSKKKQFRRGAKHAARSMDDAGT